MPSTITKLPKLQLHLIDNALTPGENSITQETYKIKVKSFTSKDSWYSLWHLRVMKGSIEMLACDFIVKGFTKKTFKDSLNGSIQTLVSINLDLYQPLNIRICVNLVNALST